MWRLKGRFSDGRLRAHHGGIIVKVCGNVWANVRIIMLKLFRVPSCVNK